LFEKRKERNEEIDLLNCIQLCDKFTLADKRKEIKNILDFESRNENDSMLDKIQDLRDKLTHSQDLVTGTSWPEIIEVSEKMTQILLNCEQIVYN
jgi:hypothetical protein